MPRAKVLVKDAKAHQQIRTADWSEAESHASAVRNFLIPDKINWLSALSEHVPTCTEHAKSIWCQKYCLHAMCLEWVFVRLNRLNRCLCSYWMNSNCAQTNYVRSIFLHRPVPPRLPIAMQTTGVAFLEFLRVTRTFGRRRPLLIRGAWLFWPHTKLLLNWRQSENNNLLRQINTKE